MKNIVKPDPLLGIGAAFILSAFALFYATVAIGQLSLFSGVQFTNIDNEVVPYPTPFALWAIPVLLLAGGIACLFTHARQATPNIEVELDDQASTRE